MRSAIRQPEACGQRTPVGLIDPAQVRLLDDPIEMVYQVGVSEPPYSQFATWVGWPALCPEAAVVFYEIAEPAIAFCMGQPEGIRAIFETARELPHRLYAVGPQAHLDELSRWYRFGKTNRMQRMVRAADVAVPQARAARALSPDDLHEIIEVLAPQGMRVDLMQLHHGNYFGVRHEERLASVAAAHFVSSSRSLAFVGNMATRPEFQRQGFATAAIEGLLNELTAKVDLFCLDVDVSNEAAVKLYETLGFAPRCQHVEGLGQRAL